MKSNRMLGLLSEMIMNLKPSSTGGIESGRNTTKKNYRVTHRVISGRKVENAVKRMIKK